MADRQSIGDLGLRGIKTFCTLIGGDPPVELADFDVAPSKTTLQISAPSQDSNYGYWQGPTP